MGPPLTDFCRLVPARLLCHPHPQFVSSQTGWAGGASSPQVRPGGWLGRQTGGFEPIPLPRVPGRQDWTGLGAHPTPPAPTPSLPQTDRRTDPTFSPHPLPAAPIPPPFARFRRVETTPHTPLPHPTPTVPPDWWSPGGTDMTPGGWVVEWNSGSGPRWEFQFLTPFPDPNSSTPQVGG